MEMGAATNTAAGGGALDAATAAANSLFSVKEEPLDFDLMVKVESDLDLDLHDDSGSGVVDKKITASGKATAASAAASSAVPLIGSSNSAFQPYKQQSLTILTNLQRGNVKTTNKENGPESLTFHEKAAKASLTDTDITESTVNAKDPNGYTPLMWAAFHGRLTIVQKLIEKGAQLDLYGPDGETALMFSACNGHTEVLSYLLSKGADVDTEDDAGNTALMNAAYGNHADCVVQLLKRGASMSKPNGIGDTPFEIAINKGHLAAQYAMEDFLKEEIEMSIASAFSTAGGVGVPEVPATTTKNSNNLNSSSSSSVSTTIISNGNCNNNSSSGNIIVFTNCNGIGGGDSVENGGGAGGGGASFTNGSTIIASTNTTNNSHHK